MNTAPSSLNIISYRTNLLSPKHPTGAISLWCFCPITFSFERESEHFCGSSPFLFYFSWKCIDCYVFHIIICHLNFKFTFVYIGIHNLLSKTYLSQILFKSNVGFSELVKLINFKLYSISWNVSIFSHCQIEFSLFQYFCIIRCLSIKLHVDFTLYSITCTRRWKQQWYTWFCSGSLTAMFANHLVGSKSEQFVT